MGETGLPGFDECNYALKSAAGVNSLPSQLALVARSLRLCLPQLSAYRQGLQIHTHTLSSPQTSHRYRATALQPQPQPPLIRALELSMQPQWYWMNMWKENTADTHQYNTTIHTRSETSTHIALGCNLCFFLEVLCKNSGITMTPISSYTHQHTQSVRW